MSHITWRSRLRRGAIIGGSFTGAALLQQFAILPLYNAGIAQPLFAPVNAIVGLLLVPSRTIAYQIYAPENHHSGPITLLALYACTFVLYGGLGVLVSNSAARKRAQPGAAETVSTPDHLDQANEPALPDYHENTTPADTMPRRTFLRVGAARVGALAATSACVGTTAYAALLEPSLLPVTYHMHQVNNLPAELAGLKIVQLSDIHHGQWISLSFVRRMVRMVNAMNAEIILLNGDYVAGHRRYIAPVVEVLGHLQAKIAVLGVLGNHDWWEGAGECRQHFKIAGIPLIDNANRFLGADRQLRKAATSPGLCLAGVGDLWEDEVDIASALHGAPDEMPRILLSHNPDVAEMPELSKGKARIDLMLSGHTHGGQVRIPFLGTPIVPSDYGQKYAQGLVQGPSCPVYVSRGIGMTVLPVRLGVPPEIAVHTLQPA